MIENKNIGSSFESFLKNEGTYTTDQLKKIGSSFESFLKNEGTCEETTAQAIKRVLNFQESKNI